MPFTFFAHQVPVVPIKRVAPDRWDGLGLVVGSIMPDLWYVTQGWVFGPGGMALWVNAHLPGQFVTHCVLAGCLLTWVVRRVVAPVVPAALPDAPPFHLHDYRLLALGRHRWWVTAYSVALGAATHLLMDGFTHGDHFGVEIVPWLGRTWFTVGSHHVAPYKVFQYLGHTVGSAVGLWMAWVIGRDRLLSVWHGGATTADLPRLGARGVALVRRVLAVSVALGVAYAGLRVGDGLVTAFIAFVWVVLIGAIVAGRLGRKHLGPDRGVSPFTVAATSPPALDPLVE